LTLILIYAKNAILGVLIAWMGHFYTVKCVKMGITYSLVFKLAVLTIVLMATIRTKTYINVYSAILNAKNVLDQVKICVMNVIRRIYFNFRHVP